MALDAGEPCLMIISEGLNVASYLFVLMRLSSSSVRFLKFVQHLAQFAQLVIIFSAYIARQFCTKVLSVGTRRPKS